MALVSAMRELNKNRRFFAATIEGLAEGWIDASDPGVEHASGGPPEDPWRVTHTFLTYSKFVFKCIVSPVTYKVVGQPGKDEQGVRWYYECERVSRV